MAELPYPINAKDLTTALQQMQRLMDDLYQNRVAGAEVGDVLEIGSDDVLSINLASVGGLEKSAGELKVKTSATGGIQLTADGVVAKVKAGGGITVDADGFQATSGAFVASTLYDANTILKADTDDTPVALTVDQQRLVGRITGGVITGLTAAQVRTLLALATTDAVNFGNITIGTGVAGTDYTLTFDGETNDGVVTWMEDEDYFKFADDIHFGDGTNYGNISDTDGQMTWGGTFLKKLTLRPQLVEKSSKAGGTPTQVYRGINVGYSLPVWSAPAPDEELYWRMRIPARWDGVTDPQFGMCVTLSAAEDVGDKFKFSLEWQSTAEGAEMGTTTSITYSEQTLLAGRAAAYDTYFVFFNFDANDVTNPLVVGEMLQCRIRRVAASSLEVSNEVIIWDWASMWPINKVYGAWSVETNDT